MKKISNRFIGALGWLFSIGFALAIPTFLVAFILFNYYAKDLPDYGQLAKYDPPTTTRLYAADGKLLAEYATEKRVFVPLSAIPKLVRNAFISAEDKNFYSHQGIDFSGLVRAVRDNIINYGKGKSLVGGSTITQQVVKNFLLSNEKSFERKIKEAILAMRISKVYSKDRILELYLNEIYLGLGSYGVAAAAQNYFNKSLDELTIEEAALLAAEPKAPGLYNPHKNYDATKIRRDWVVERMFEDGYINKEQAEAAKETPIVLRERAKAEVVSADFFSEEVRRSLADMYGSDVLYGGGLVVKTTLDPNLQKFTDTALRNALIAYDRRRGYRGALGNINNKKEWEGSIKSLTQKHSYHLLENQKLAVISGLDKNFAEIFFTDEKYGTIPFSFLKWTRRVIADGKLGEAVTKPADILKLGDVVIVNPPDEQEINIFKKDKTIKKHKGDIWSLAQIPEINGAMVVLDPHTGRVLAMSGGYSYGGSEFNRATQAKRQPGSVFKPFVYMAGLEDGFTPSTVLLDAPVEVSPNGSSKSWRPSNYHGEYLGPTTMRVGLEKSRNTMTVRLAQVIGLDRVLEIGKRFGIYDNPQNNFSIVLGAEETTLLRMVAAYGMIANGGNKIIPALIEKIDDRQGKTIYRRDNRICNKCLLSSIPDSGKEPPLPEIADNKEMIVDPRINYQIISMLNGVTTRGTAARAQTIGKIVAGKTGTTNNSKDTWFIGFTPDLVAGVFIGYDKPHTLGRRETGSSVALPAFIEFMKNALADTPNKPFSIPRGIQLVRVNLHTGFPPEEMETQNIKIIDEAFVVGSPIFSPYTNPEGEQENIVINPPDSGTPEAIITPEENYRNDNFEEIPLQRQPTNGSGIGLY